MLKLNDKTRGALYAILGLLFAMPWWVLLFSHHRGETLWSVVARTVQACLYIPSDVLPKIFGYELGDRIAFLIHWGFFGLPVFFFVHGLFLYEKARARERSSTK